MGLWATISRQFRTWRQRAAANLAGHASPLEAVPFEELTTRYYKFGHEVYDEFIRRLQQIVFYAAEEYAFRTNPAVEQEEIEELTQRVFEDFAPEFASGSPSSLLTRFAGAIRRVLDDQAFKAIAHRYYWLLPIYHLEDDQQRRFMSALYQMGLGTETGKNFGQDLAQRFGVSTARAFQILKEGHSSLGVIIRSDFSPEELNELTEGYVA